MGTVTDLIAYKMAREEPPPDPIDDSNTNRLWDIFLNIAQKSFEWRDREALEELKEIIEQLNPTLEIQSPFAGISIGR